MGACKRECKKEEKDGCEDYAATQNRGTYNYWIDKAFNEQSTKSPIKIKRSIWTCGTL